METIAQIFDSFCNANTFHSIVDTFNKLCQIAGIKSSDRKNGKIFYYQLRKNVNSWKAQSLWAKLDKRACRWEYSNGTACSNTNVLVIGCGPCGLRAAIEMALLGCRVLIIEKRDGFTRNNVLHLWPFLIHDLKSLGAKKFFGKFCAGAIDHISIRTLQCILLKVALLVGVEIYSGVEFHDFLEPCISSKGEKVGWKAKISPEDHPCSEFVFDVCISADGKRNTMQQFKRKEFRGKLAIAITANFINHNTKEEACIEEISGVAYIFNQKFFRDLNAEAGIDLENIVYYRDETHYFVMTAKKSSLLNKRVLIQDFEDPETLLSRNNVNQEELLAYAREAADISTCHKLLNLEYAHNHYGQPDVAMFDFTSMFAAECASRIIERDGFKLLLGLVGDTLLEPFWPTGSGCARGFLSAFDAAWMVRAWGSGKMSPLNILAERESIYQLLSQTTPENLNRNYLGYTIDPNTRYVNLQCCFVRPSQVRNLYDCTDSAYLDEIVRNSEQNTLKYDAARNSYNILRWCQKQLQDYKNIVTVNDLSLSFKNGIALACLVHKFRPQLIYVYSLDPLNIEYNNQLVFDIIHREFGIRPYLSLSDVLRHSPPDRNIVAAYISAIYDYFTQEDNKILQINASNKQNPGLLTQKINQKKDELERSLKRNIDDIEKDPYFNRSYKYERFDEFDLIETDLLNCKNKEEDLQVLLQGGRNKVSVLAKGLAKKFSGESPSKSTQIPKQFSIAKPKPSDLCFFCKQQVYLVEKFTAEGLNFHRDCFRCHYCKTLLRISCYSYQRQPVGLGRFYCVHHQGLQLPINSKPPIHPHISSPHKISSYTEPYVHMATNIKLTPSKFEIKRTERAEYFTESEMEETELDQTRHNLSTRKIFESASSSSEEEELQFSINSGSDEEPDLTWAELARNYSNHLRKTRQNSLQRISKEQLPISHSSESSVSGSGTETVGASDADWETDEDRGSTTPEDSNTIVNSVKSNSFIKVPTSFPTNIASKEIKSQPSVEIMRNRMAFFSTISQPVRIDARTFLGLDGLKNSQQLDASEEKENLNDVETEKIVCIDDVVKFDDKKVLNVQDNAVKSSPARSRIRKNSELKKEGSKKIERRGTSKVKQITKRRKKKDRKRGSTSNEDRVLGNFSKDNIVPKKNALNNIKIERISNNIINQSSIESGNIKSSCQELNDIMIDAMNSPSVDLKCQDNNDINNMVLSDSCNSLNSKSPESVLESHKGTQIEILQPKISDISLDVETFSFESTINDQPYNVVVDAQSIGDAANISLSPNPSVVSLIADTPIGNQNTEGVISDIANADFINSNTIQNDKQNLSENIVNDNPIEIQTDCKENEKIIERPNNNGSKMNIILKQELDCKMTNNVSINSNGITNGISNINGLDYNKITLAPCASIDTTDDDNDDDLGDDVDGMDIQIIKDINILHSEFDNSISQLNGANNDIDKNKSFFEPTNSGNIQYASEDESQILRVGCINQTIDYCSINTSDISLNLAPVERIDKLLDCLSVMKQAVSVSSIEGGFSVPLVSDTSRDILNMPYNASIDADDISEMSVQTRDGFLSVSDRLNGILLGSTGSSNTTLHDSENIYLDGRTSSEIIYKSDKFVGNDQEIICELVMIPDENGSSVDAESKDSIEINSLGRRTKHSNAIASGVDILLSPSRLVDAKRRFFYEPPQPLRIDHKKIVEEIHDKKFVNGHVQHPVDSPVDTIKLEKQEVQSSLNFDIKNQNTLPLKTDKLTSKTKGNKNNELVYPYDAEMSDTVADMNQLRTKQIVLDKTRPSSVFIVMEQNRKSKDKTSPIKRPTSAKPAESKLPYSCHSDVVSADEAIINNLRNNNQKNGSPIIKSAPEKKKKSLLSLIIPSKSFDKKEKSTDCDSALIQLLCVHG